MSDDAITEGTLAAARRPGFASRPAGWDALAAELARWAESGRTATFWWRDDDAESASPELDRLIQLAQGFALPASLAVIPASLEGSLVSAVGAEPSLVVLQHGFRHQNHAPPGAKKCELGGERRRNVVLAELAQGRDQLAEAFQDRFRPILVPPWNRIDPGLIPLLPEAGYAGLSTSGPRPVVADRAELIQVNTHIDPVDWSRRRFLGLERALEPAIRHLEARRTGAADAAEPTGLLTHHRVHDADTWAFIEGFLERTLGHRAVRWLGADEAFSTAQGRRLG